MYIIAYNVVGLSLYLPCFRVYFVVILYVVFYIHMACLLLPQIVVYITSCSLSLTVNNIVYFIQHNLNLLSSDYSSFYNRAMLYSTHHIHCLIFSYQLQTISLSVCLLRGRRHLAQYSYIAFLSYLGFSALQRPYNRLPVYLEQGDTYNTLICKRVPFWHAYSQFFCNDSAQYIYTYILHTTYFCTPYLSLAISHFYLVQNIER